MMPNKAEWKERLEKVLKAEAKAKGYSGDRFDRYVYGTLRQVEAERKKKSKDDARSGS